MNKKVLIFKNDRTGDLFTSLGIINKILNKHSNQNITIYLSNINHKFSFLFPTLNKKIISMKLSILEKLNIFFYILFNKVDDVYILKPKNFYFYLPFIFRKIKFHAVIIKSQKNRPTNFLIKYLHKFVEINRIENKKKKSTYIIQNELIADIPTKNLLNLDFKVNHNFQYPKKFVYFHYKKNLFQNLLQWDLEKVILLINFLSLNYENVLFSSEFKDEDINNFFSKNFNTYDYDIFKYQSLNDKNIFFLKNIDGYDLFDAINHSSNIVSPEGIITHIGYFLKKPLLALMHFNLYSRKDFVSQIISCKEWFPPDDYKFTVLKKDFEKSLKKLSKRI
jgi:hypothetical protein